MTYDLYIGNKSYSSWSLRGWLMFEKFGLPYREHMVPLYDPRMPEILAEVAPATLVPVMRTPDGIVVGETMAMAETLAERHPDAGLWPADAAHRAQARWMVAEVHAGFSALRAACPMNIAHIWQGFEPDAAVMADLARLELLWSQAPGGDGPWLFGDYSLADAFFAPIATRLVSYTLPRSAAAQRYIDAHMTDPAFLKWRKVAVTEAPIVGVYDKDLPKAAWPYAL